MSLRLRIRGPVVIPILAFGAAFGFAGAKPGPAASPDGVAWPQFRGPGGHGRSEAQGLPLTWSDERNIAWKKALPGPGASSPVVQDGRVYLTCFSGYATSAREPGDMSKLEYHLLCLNLADGRLLWETKVRPKLPEQERVRENHGYASSTPATDGERVYAFFGKSGVFAFDLAGRQLWQTSVGTQLNGWGSAASPVLYKDLVLVNASVESGALVALDRKTGQEVWRAGGIKDSWHAPVLVPLANGKTEVVVALIRKLLAFDPDHGEALWRCDTGINWYMCPTPVAQDGIIYSIGGRNPNGGLAVRAGGRGDVTQSHVVWRVNKGSNVPSPILHDGHLYFAHENLGVVYCVNAKTGEVLYEERLSPNPGQIYASPVLAQGRLHYLGRGGRMAVVAARPVFEQLAYNSLEAGRGVFNASPAIAGSRLLLRSNRALYCLAEK